MAHFPLYILGALLVLSAIGVILLKKPVHACLAFLASLLLLTAIYLQLHAEFIAVMQILVYAGSILVIFMFVIILFQDAYLQIAEYTPRANPWLLASAACLFTAALARIGYALFQWNAKPAAVADDFGMAETLGKVLYIDFFFPFEAVITIFLIAMVGALYIGRKV